MVLAAALVALGSLGAPATGTPSFELVIDVNGVDELAVGATLLLAYGLFYCLPRGYALLGFGYAESLLLAFAAINVHHFIVDAFIWRLGRSDNNRAIVDSASRTPAPTPA